MTLLLGCLALATLNSKAQDIIQPGLPWKDTEGQIIEAHGGGLLKVKNIYYWYGENHAKGFGNKTGISCYSSKDMLHWHNEGVALPKDSVPPAYQDNSVCERPKVIYNPATRKYVMWMHLDDRHYYAAEAGVAIADRPTGPFHFIRAFRPVAFDYNEGKYSKAEPHLHEKENGNTFRDMNLFVDDDGKAYVLYASESNATLYCVQLEDTYTDIRRPAVLNKTWARLFINQYREAPAPFKFRHKYYLITSAQTGWAPNAARYSMADHILGPWTDKGNPCVGTDSSTTFHSQSTYVIPSPRGKGHFIFMADRWDSKQLQNSTYIWLPFSIAKDGSFRLLFQPAWKP